MLTYRVQVDHAVAMGAVPVGSRTYPGLGSLAEWTGENIGATAWLDEDAVKLAERAGYR